MNKVVMALVALMLTFGSSDLQAAGDHKKHGAGGSKASQDATGTFTYQETVEGVRAEFQVMSLAQMNMQDPGGATHHVMVKFVDDQTQNQIKTAAGRIKVIDPNGQETIGDLKDYAGVYAANFTFNAKGRYGIICLFKIDDKKRLVKFWYPHA